MSFLSDHPRPSDSRSTHLRRECIQPHQRPHHHLRDPRFTTDYANDLPREVGNGKYYKKDIGEDDKFYLPASVDEKWCTPGYQPKRPNKGYDLTVNDYYFHPIQYGGPAWAQVVNTPFQTDN